MHALSQVEVANEYYSALKAHSSYWTNPDVPAFIMHELFTASPFVPVSHGGDARYTSASNLADHEM